MSKFRDLILNDNFDYKTEYEKLLEEFASLHLSYKMQLQHDCFINEEVEHQRKIINRLSRKIQRLKRWSLKPRTNEVLLMNESTYWNIIKDYRELKERINKAIHYIEYDMYVDMYVDELLKILNGDNE